MARITEKQIREVFEQVCDFAGIPTSADKAVAMNKEYYMSFDYAPHYGGYCMYKVKVKGGTTSRDHFEIGMSRVKAGEFIMLLYGIEAGLKYKQN